MKKESPFKRFFSRSAIRRPQATAIEPPQSSVTSAVEEADNQDPPKSEFDRFMETYVYPAVEERRASAVEPVQPQRKPTRMVSQDSEETTANVIKSIPLPKDLWNRHILSRLPDEAISLFSEAYQSSPNILNDFYNDRFNFNRFDSLPLLMQAKRDGVAVNLQLLHELFKKPDAYTTMRPLLLEENASWVIAALCGDLKWLLEKFGDGFTHKFTQKAPYQRSILFFLVFGGHLGIIKKYFSQKLALQRGTPTNKELNHIAASNGFFEICDYLETFFNESPFDLYLSTLKATVHFYAFYGQLDRLKSAIQQRPSLLTEFMHGYDLLFSAVEGGDVATVRYLVNGVKSQLTKPVEHIGDTCFHIATERGHSKLLELFIKEFNVSPPQEISVALKDIVLTRCGISGSWDCFWLLSPYYQSHPMMAQSMAEIPMYAIAENHVDFFDQFIAKFGNTFAGKSNDHGWKISHFVIRSVNCRTIRKMLEEHKIDLTEQNNAGETALLTLAKLAVRRKSELTWIVVADILGAFNKSFDYRLHTIPDETGITLEALIIQHNKQDLFPDLEFATSAPSFQ